MDFSKIDVPDTAIIHIEHPTHGKLFGGEKNAEPCTIEVFGPSSDEAVEYRRKATKRLSERLAKKGVKGLSQIPPEELERIEIEKLVAMTANVSNIEMNGVKVTVKNIGDLYADPKLGWVRDQVSEKIGSWEDFLG